MQSLSPLLIFYSLNTDDDERKSHQDNNHGKKNTKSVSFGKKKRALAQDSDIEFQEDEMYVVSILLSSVIFLLTFASTA